MKNDYEEWDEDNWEQTQPQSGPIAKAFYPFDSKERFTTCTMCQVVLDDTQNIL